MTNPTNNEEWREEFAETISNVIGLTTVDSLKIQDFIAAQIQAAEKRGYDKGYDDDKPPDKILWERMWAWNDEWQAEKPKERALTWQDGLKLIEWKIAQARTEGKREGLEEAKRSLPKRLQTQWGTA